MTETTEKIVLPSESSDGFAHFRLSRDQWFVKFYLWLYEASPSNINTCKLFWAYVFALPALVLRGIFGIVEIAAGALPERKPKPVSVRPYSEKPLGAPKLEKQGPSKMERILDSVANALSAFYARVAPALRYVGIGLGILIGLAAAALLVYLAITETAKFFTTLGIAAGVLAFAALVITLAIKYDESPNRRRRTGPPGFVKVFKRLFKGFHTHTCAKIDLS